jgi:hypothetical protein
MVENARWPILISPKSHGCKILLEVSAELMFKPRQNLNWVTIYLLQIPAYVYSMLYRTSHLLSIVYGSGTMTLVQGEFKVGQTPPYQIVQYLFSVGAPVRRSTAGSGISIWGSFMKVFLKVILYVRDGLFGGPHLLGASTCARSRESIAPLVIT